MTDLDLINEGYIEGKKSFDFLFAKILEGFNFELVYTAMKALDWHWAMGDNRMGIPSVDTLKMRARALLFEIYEKERGTVSTAGFTAGWDEGELYLKFTLEECHTIDM